MNKRIVLCADDYGQAPAVSQGILALVKMGRLSAVSCLVTSSSWSEHAQWLQAYQQEVSVGLHFNLTEGQALSSQYQQCYGQSFSSLPAVLMKAVMRYWDQAVLAAECHAQLDAFVAHMGCLPRFVDGHQHVHQFPVIRDAFIQVYKERLQQQHTTVRWVNERSRNSLKKWIIFMAGTPAFKRLLDTHGVRHNHSFAGAYAFSQARYYQRYFRQFLVEIKEGGIIMCHPGLADAQDNLAVSRQAEYKYLSSEHFIDDCRAAKVTIA